LKALIVTGKSVTGSALNVEMSIMQQSAQHAFKDVVTRMILAVLFALLLLAAQGSLAF
jgi:hypothetical protein